MIGLELGQSADVEKGVLVQSVKMASPAAFAGIEVALDYPVSLYSFSAGCLVQSVDGQAGQFLTTVGTERLQGVSMMRQIMAAQLPGNFLPECGLSALLLIRRN